MSLASRYSTHKPRRIPYLYKAPETREKTMAKRQVANTSPAPKRLIGYARVSTDDQVHDAQMDELRAAGCERIFQEHGSVRITCPTGTDKIARRPDCRRCACRRPAGSTSPFGQPSVASDRGPGRTRRPFQVDPRSDRYVHTTGHVLPTGPWCCSPARACADRRANQSRHQGSKGAGQAAGQPWTSRTATRSDQGGVEGARKTLSRRADFVRPNLATNGPAASASA